AIAASDVDDRLEAPEVIGFDQRAGQDLRARAHRSVEGPTLVEVLCAVLPDADTVCEPERVLAGADALLERAPGVADVAAPDERGPARDRLGCVASERVAELREGEPSVLVLVEEAERGEGAEEAVERARIGLGRLCELVARSRAAREQVRDPQNGHDMDRLRQL